MTGKERRITDSLGVKPRNLERTASEWERGDPPIQERTKALSPDQSFDGAYFLLLMNIEIITDQCSTLGFFYLALFLDSLPCS